MYYLKLIISGFLIGFFMMFPGVGGGSVAILLNVYDNIISSCSNLFKSFKNNFLFLIFLAIGGAFGVFIAAYLLSFISLNFYDYLIYFFGGFMFCYIVNFIYKTKRDGRKSFHFLFIFLGVGIGYLLNNLPVFSLDENIFQSFLIGLFIAIALILPGVSVSYMLIIFNCYTSFMIAIKSFDFMYLIKLLMFVPLGIALTIKILEFSLTKYKIITSYIIIGFMITSLLLILPMPSGIGELNTFVLFFLSGISIFLIFGKIFKKY